MEYAEIKLPICRPRFPNKIDSVWIGAIVGLGCGVRNMQGSIIPMAAHGNHINMTLHTYKSQDDLNKLDS